MEQRRELKSGEIDLIEYLAKKAEYPLNKFWHCYYKASPMNDGGMGSILLIPPQKRKKSKTNVCWSCTNQMQASP